MVNKQPFQRTQSALHDVQSQTALERFFVLERHAGTLLCALSPSDDANRVSHVHGIFANIASGSSIVASAIIVV